MSECQIHGDLIHVPPSELHALTSPWPFSVWGIDIIGKISPKSSSGHEFILVAIDYFTKWVEAASYARLTSAGVASFIRSHIICRYGVPHELISDRGVHFRAEVDTLVQRYSIRHHRSSAYRPQTNGAVEAANKNIKRILRRMVETSRDWSEKLPFALWAYRTSFRTSTGATPYSLVYGMEAMLPVEIEMGSLRVALEQQIPEADRAQARFDQLNLLDERRLRAADHVRAYQRKMAALSKEDPRGKFRPNWSGPYFIRELTPEGAAWLMDLDGNRFSEPTNVDQLKRSITTFIVSPSFLSLLVIHLIPSRLILSLQRPISDHPEAMDQMSSSAASTWTGLIQLCSDYQGSFMDPHGLARPSLTGCSSRRGHDRLPYGASEIHPAGSALLDTWIPSCLSTWETFMEVACAMMDDFMTLFFGPVAHLMSYWGIFPFWVRFTDLRRDETCGSSWSCMLIPTHEIHMDTMFPPWSLSGVTQLGLHFAMPRCHHVFLPGDALLIYGSDSVVHVDDLDRAFDDGLTFRVTIITFSVSAFRAITVFSVSAFRAITVFSVSAFRAIIGFQINIQSHHHHFSAPAFRVIITFRFRRSEPSPCFQFRRSEPSSVFRSTFRVASSVSAFRAIIGFQIDIQSRILKPPPLSSLAFRATFSLRRLEPLVILGVVRPLLISDMVFESLMRRLRESLDPLVWLQSHYRNKGARGGRGTEARGISFLGGEAKERWRFCEIQIFLLEGASRIIFNLRVVKGSDVRPIRAMKFFVSPGVHIVIQCKVASGLPQLVEGSKCLAKSDPMGLRDNFMGGAEIVRSDPVASSRETVFEKPCRAMMSRSSNKHNRLYVRAQPSEEGITGTIDASCLDPRWVLKARSEILSEEFVCGKDLAKQNLVFWNWGHRP
ncbi:Elongation factor 2 [Vitis vinifera]|uniref:Elongation factor 2 n=1 Tax=Vitis vinifera TaxID=29760 RepID=A0A438GFN1_VITVI|nr:Elongation factor 2 [Vitis vinifera]